MIKRFGKIAVALVITGIALCLIIVLVGRPKAQSKQSDASYLKLLHEAYSAVEKRYAEKPDKEKLVKSMVDGMLAALDPHSAYLPPEPFKEMEIQMNGAFGGVGIELGMRDGRLTVIAPIDDTPAFRAGIHANDHIAKIDGKSTQGMNITAAVKIMRGEKGTAVTLTIVRAGSGRPLLFPLIRDIIKISSLKSRLLEPGYGFIRIGQFQQRTGEEFRQALKKLKDETGGELKGLVIDLRYNPGGLLNASIDVANVFIGDDVKNSLIVSTRGREPGANREFHATVGQKEPNYPVVVLINGGSASASEIVAGALQDHKRAIVIGTKSFGKGSVQSIIPLKGNAALKLTTARYYTPSGRSIQAKGIEPDIVVENIKLLPVAARQESPLKENDLEGRLAPEAQKDEKTGEKVDKKPDAPKESPHQPVTVGDMEKDYQLRRSVELIKSLHLVRGRMQ